MKHYREAAVERSTKIEEVILRAQGKKINWGQCLSPSGALYGISREWDGMRLPTLQRSRPRAIRELPRL